VVVFLNFLVSGLFLYFGHKYLYSEEVKHWEFEDGFFEYKEGSWHFPLIIHLNQVRVKTSAVDIQNEKLELHLNPLAFLYEERHFVTVLLDDIRLNTLSDTTSTPEVDSLKNDAIQPFDIDIPTIPIPYKVMFKDFKLLKDDSLLVSMGAFRLKQNKINKYKISGYNINALDQEINTVNLDFFYSGSDSILIKLNLLNPKDSISIEAKVPQKQASSIRLNANIDYNNPLPQISNSIPMLENLHLQADLKFDWISYATDGYLNFDVSTKKDQYLNGMFPIPSGMFLGSFVFNKDTVESDLSFESPTEEALYLKGKGTLEESNWKLSISNYDMIIGSHALPADIVDGRVNLNGTKLRVNAKTRDLSSFQYKMDFTKGGDFQAHVNFSPSETWTNLWTKNSAILNPGSKISATFKDGIFDGELIGSTDNTYGMALDSFALPFKLYPNYLEINEGLVKAKDIAWNLNGKVIWDKLNNDEFYQFDLLSPKGNKAAIWGDFIGHFSLQSSEIPLHKIPFNTQIIPQDLIGHFTGQWTTYFNEKRKGSALGELNLKYKNIPLDLSFNIKEHLDSTMVNDLKINTKGAELYGDVLLLGPLANPELKELNLSTLGTGLNFLEAFTKTPINGTLVGDLHYYKEDLKSSVDGNFHIDSLSIGKLENPYIVAERLELSAIKDTLRLHTRIKAGNFGQWNSEVGLDVANIFDTQWKWATGIATDNDGLFWGTGNFSPSQGNLEGSFNVQGPWFLPVEAVSIINSSVQGDFTWSNLSNLKTLHANIPSSHAEVKIADKIQTKANFNTKLKGGLIDFQGIAYADSNTSVNIYSKYDINDNEIKLIKADADYLNFRLDSLTTIRAWNLEVNHRLKNKWLEIPFKADAVEYESYLAGVGDVFARTKQPSGQFNQPLFSTPANPKIAGNIDIQKLLIRNNNYPSLGVGGLTDLVKGAASSIFSSKRNSKPKIINHSVKKTSSKPIELDFNIKDLGEDSIMAITNIYDIPITLDLSLTGTTNNPLLNGDITSTETGSLYMMDTKFDLNSIDIGWNYQSIEDGRLTVLSSKELPYQQEQESTIKENCLINMDIRGTIGNFKLEPNAACGGQDEMPADKIFTSIMIGHVSETSDTEWNKITEKLIILGSEKLIKDGVNETIRRFKFTDRDMIRKVGITVSDDDNTTDSTSIFVSFNVPGVDSRDLNVNFTRVWDTGSDIDYDDYTKLAISLNLWNSIQGTGLLADYIRSEGKDPQIWQTEVGVTSKNYISTSTEGGTENEIEANVGVSFARPFWNWCFLGIGDCRD
jgi:hypothetical protein